MRRDGDRLLDHLSAARSTVLLCAPFIKAAVLERLLLAIDPAVTVEVITRWRATEVAAGVSDLEVFELVKARANTVLRLQDNLHAKIYLADDQVLMGSANLTATALGWCDRPNLELLTTASISHEDIVACLLNLAAARPATEEERLAIQAKVDRLAPQRLPEGQPVVPALAERWLPMVGAPDRLFQAYVPALRGRLTAETAEMAKRDLDALALPAGLAEAEFRTQAAERFSAMPAVRQLLDAADRDLTDAAAIEMIGAMLPASDLAPAIRWTIVREWLTYFLRDRYEIAPQSFITRLRPKGAR